MSEYQLLIDLIREVVCENSKVHLRNNNELSDEQLHILYKLAKAQDLAHIVGVSLQNALNENTSQIKKFLPKHKYRQCIGMLI